MATEPGYVVVGGGTGALGGAVVRRLAGDGWQVVVPARDPARASVPAGVQVVRCDLRVDSDVDALATEVAQYGRWTGLVNASGGWTTGSAVRSSSELVHDQLELNLVGPWRLARAAALAMRATGGGAIVNVGSHAAVAAARGSAAYQVSKTALLRLTEVMALEVRDAGIRVNAVLPGTMDTAANRASMPDADRTSWVAVDDVAAVIAWLLSDDAAAVTGAAIPVP